MVIKKIKITDLHKPEQNVRIHTEKQIREFVRSVKMFGQIRPIVIDEDNMILCGNGLYDAMTEAGMEEADCYCYSGLTENQKKKLMIADNKIFSLGIEDINTLNSFISDLSDDLDIPGYNEDILAQMVADADEITARLTEYGTLSPEEIENIRQAGVRRDERMAAPLEPNNGVIGFNNAENGQNGDVRPMSGSNGAEAAHNVHVSAEDARMDPMQEGMDAEIRRFVLCPNCGERIWL